MRFAKGSSTYREVLRVLGLRTGNGVVPVAGSLIVDSSREGVHVPWGRQCLASTVRWVRLPSLPPDFEMVG